MAVINVNINGAIIQSICASYSLHIRWGERERERERYRTKKPFQLADTHQRPMKIIAMDCKWPQRNGRVEKRTQIDIMYIVQKRLSHTGYDCFIKLISSRIMYVCDSAKILSIKKVKKANTKHIDISSQGTCHIFTPRSVFCFVEGEHRRR